MTDNGVWLSPSRREVSFSRDAHAGCYALEDESFWFQHRNAVLLAVLDRFAPTGVILDVGGGNGYVARGLINAGHPTILLEPGEVGVRNALARGLRPIICASLQDAGFRPGVLPAVGLFDVLEHIEHEVEFLRMLRSLMRADARLYVTVPALPWLWSNADSGAGHFRRYTRATLLGGLRAAGFCIEHFTYFFAFLTLPILVGRTARDRLRRHDAGASLQQQAVREHAPKQPLVRTALAGLARFECGLVRRGRTLPIGSSCLAVATHAG